MDICGKVAETKIASGKAVYDAEREKQKLDAVSAMADSEFNQVAVRELFSQMMSISRKYQYSILAEHGRAMKLGFEQSGSAAYGGRARGTPGSGRRLQPCGGHSVFWRESRNLSCGPF